MSKSIYVEIDISSEANKAEEWRLDFNYYPGFRGSYEEPGYAAEVEFISAKNEETKETMSFDAFCEKYEISNGTMDDWETRALDSVAEMDDYYDEEDFDDLMYEENNGL